MRVSSKMMSGNIKSNLFKQAEQLLDTQRQIVTGKRISKPSDDPVGMGEVLEYRKTIASLDQFGENIDHGKLHIDAVEEILGTVYDLLTDARRISADTNPDINASMAQQVGVIREQVRQLANSKIDDNYIFAGDLTDTEPFDTTATYQGDNGTKELMIGDNIQISFEADGSQIFQGAGDVFSILSNLQTALQTNNTAAIDAQMGPLSNAIDQIKTVRADNASKYKRLEASENHYQSFKVHIEEALSRTEDADITQAVIDLQLQETAYETSLATAAKIVQPSLMDFLR